MSISRSLGFVWPTLQRLCRWNQQNVSEYHQFLGNSTALLPRAHVEAITKTLCVHWQTGLSPYGGGSREVGINPISINQKVTDCLVGGSPRQLHQSRAGESHASCGTGIRRSQMDLPVSYTAMQRLHPLDGRCWVTGS